MSEAMNYKLPPLPEQKWFDTHQGLQRAFTAEQMQALATAATEPLLQRIAELERQLEEAQKDAQIIRNQALEDAANCCDQLKAPPSCSIVDSSLWDVATLAAGDAIRSMKKEQP